MHCQTDAVDHNDRSEFIPRSGKHKHGLVVREATVQDRLEDVIDNSLVVLDHPPDIDPLDGPSRSGIQIVLVPEVVGPRIPSIGR